MRIEWINPEKSNFFNTSQISSKVSENMGIIWCICKKAFIKKALNKNIKFPEDDTAASAFIPKNCPTIAESAELYNCWKRLLRLYSRRCL